MRIGVNLLLNRKVVKWDNNVKHIGNGLNLAPDGSVDIQLKQQECFQQINRFLGDYRGVRWDILAHLL